MIKYLLVGLLVFIGFAVAFLPASLVQSALEAVPDADLQAPTGTVWSGQGTLTVLDPQRQPQRFDNVSWAFQPTSLLSLAAAYKLVHQQTQAVVSYGLAGVSVKVTGELPLKQAQPWLEPHQLELGGKLSTDQLTLELDPAEPWTTLDVGGTIDWTGGPVSYFVAQRQSHAILPPLQLRLTTDPASPWRVQGETFGEVDYPLISMALNESGYVKVSITKRLTQLVGSPWPGSDPDHATILEVEQPLF